MIGYQESELGELLSAAFLLGFVFLVISCRRRLRSWATLLGIYLFLLGLQVSMPIGRTLGMIPAVLAAFFPAVPLVAIFITLGFIPELNPRDRDNVLSRLDRQIFRVDVSVWMERFASPVVTEVMQAAYLAYYVLPFVLLGTLYHRGHEDAFQVCVSALLLSHYLAFIGYLLVPALGPRFALADRYRTELKGALLADYLRDILDLLEGIKRDAFPSGHTAAILVTAVYAVKFTPEMSLWFVAIAVLMILSTIYLRYHYAVDVLAGLLLGTLCIGIVVLLR